MSTSQLWFIAIIFGGADRNRTDVQGVAVLCIATLPPHLFKLDTLTSTPYYKNLVKNDADFTFKISIFGVKRHCNNEDVRYLMTQSQNNFQEAREAMIDSQIHPMGVVSEEILGAFHIVPREQFVPEEKQGICYSDEDIELAQGRYLMEPAVLARLLQAAEPKKSDVALTVGSGAGYHAAILSHLVTTVIALDDDDAFLKTAQEAWDQTECSNIASLSGSLTDGMPDHAPYDLIFVNGAMSSVPQAMKEQLSVGGRLVILLKESGEKLAKAMLIQRLENDIYAEKVLFESGTPYLKGFEPEKEFVF